MREPAPPFRGAGSLWPWKASAQTFPSLRRAFCDHDRAATLAGSPVCWKSSQQGERVVPHLDRQPRHPRSGTPLLGLEASQSFPPMRVIQVRSAATEAETCSRGGRVQCWAGSAWRVIDSENAGGYSPLDFPPFGRFVLGFLETERERGGEVYAESRSRGHAARRPIS
jgi:hypothetical protein